MQDIVGQGWVSNSSVAFRNWDRGLALVSLRLTDNAVLFATEA